MLMFVIQHQPHRAGTDLGRELVACLLAHGSTFSRVGASGKPGAVHGAWANIPPKRNRTEAMCFSRYLYRARNLVERFFNKIKHCRRVATRYDKLAANYL